MRSEILTYGGSHFDLLNPENSVFGIEDIAHALSHICRFTGHVREFYSAAQHSLLVSELLPKDLAMMGLLHDAAEAFIGDVSTPLKRLLPDYRAIEARVERVIFERFGLPHELPPEIKLADLSMLATEVRDLMPHRVADWIWNTIEGVHPSRERIEVMSPEEAKSQFIAKYNSLKNQIPVVTAQPCNL